MSAPIYFHVYVFVSYVIYFYVCVFLSGVSEGVDMDWLSSLVSASTLTCTSR
jgi:hypothetical protein